LSYGRRPAAGPQDCTRIADLDSGSESVGVGFATP